MLARRDTRSEAARLRRLSPLQTLENQSQIWGICGHSCTGREGLPPSWKLSYKTYVLRFTRESRFSFNQRIARILICYQILAVCWQRRAGPQRLSASAAHGYLRVRMAGLCYDQHHVSVVTGKVGIRLTRA